MVKRQGCWQYEKAFGKPLDIGPSDYARAADYMFDAGSEITAARAICGLLLTGSAKCVR